MNNTKDDAYYIAKAIKDIDAIESYFQNKTYEQFIKDDMLLDAIMFRLVQMIENIKNISTKFKNYHPNIDWGKIVGFRNGIVHEYGSTDYSVVYQIINEDLSELRDTLLH